MKVIKRLSLILIALVFVSLVSLASTMHVKAQTRQMTLSKVGSVYVLTDSGGASGTLTVTQALANGTLKATMAGSWHTVGSSSTFTVTFSGGRDVIMFLTGAGVIDTWYVDAYSAGELYATNGIDHTFRPFGVTCGLTETHLTSVSSLSGAFSPYSGHVNKIVRFKAPHDFACQFSVTINLLSTDTFRTYDWLDSYSSHVPGIVTVTGTAPTYTCLRSGGGITSDCGGWLPPDSTWQLDLYYTNATKPHTVLNNNFYAFAFDTAGDSSYLYTWTNFTLQ